MKNVLYGKEDEARDWERLLERICNDLQAYDDGCPDCKEPRRIEGDDAYCAKCESGEAISDIAGRWWPDETD